MTKSDISPICLAEVMATKKAVFNVRHLMEVSSIGSNGGLVRAVRTKDRSQGGVLTLDVGRILSAPLI